jgi:hypothetical protein
MIEAYHFSSITINGQAYDYDVEVRPDGEVLEWQRREGHLIDVDDVKRAVEEEPEVIVIGSGYSGMAKVSQAAKNFIEERKIALTVDVTGEAVKTFNIICEESEEEEGKSKRVIGLFHLTC